MTTVINPAASPLAAVNFIPGRPLLEAFAGATGLKTNLVFVKDGMIERAAAEGTDSPVDVLLLVDIGRLAEAKALTGAPRELHTSMRSQRRL